MAEHFLGGDAGFYESVVHGLRSRGWSRIEAEGEALDRLEALRAQRMAVSVAKEMM